MRVSHAEAWRVKNAFAALLLPRLRGDRRTGEVGPACGVHFEEATGEETSPNWFLGHKSAVQVREALRKRQNGRDGRVLRLVIEAAVGALGAH